MSGLGSAVAGVVQAGASIYSNQQNIKFQKEQNAQNLAWQERMIREQREYDDPAAQMERLQEAGINPALASAGTSISSGNTMTGSPDPATQAPRMSNLGTDVGAAVHTGIDLLKGTIEAKGEELDNLRARLAYRLELETFSTKVEKTILENKQIMQGIEESKQRLSTLSSEERLNKVRAATEEALRQPQIDKLIQDVAESKARESEAFARAKTEGERQKLIQQQVKVEKQRIVLLQSEIRLNNAKAETETTVQELNQSQSSRNSEEVRLQAEEIGRKTAKDAFDRYMAEVEQGKYVDFHGHKRLTARERKEHKRRSGYDAGERRAEMVREVTSAVNTFLDRSGNVRNNQ